MDARNLRWYWPNEEAGVTVYHVRGFCDTGTHRLVPGPAWVTLSTEETFHAAADAVLRLREGDPTGRSITCMEIVPEYRCVCKPTLEVQK